MHLHIGPETAVLVSDVDEAFAAIVAYQIRVAIQAAIYYLPPSPFYLYGPNQTQRVATAPSNQAFDRSLRDPSRTGVCEIFEVVAATAHSARYSKPVITEMPANNLSAVFRPM